MFENLLWQKNGFHNSESHAKLFEADWNTYVLVCMYWNNIYTKLLLKIDFKQKLVQFFVIIRGDQNSLMLFIELQNITPGFESEGILILKGDKETKIFSLQYLKSRFWLI